MGYRFDLQSANWLASLLEPSGRPPVISDPERFRSAVLESRDGTRRFLSSGRYEREFDHMIEELLRWRHMDGEPGLREDYWWPEWRNWTSHFMRRHWTACIIPSGREGELDRFLCSYELLRELVDFSPEHRGLILQPDEPPSESFSLVDVFPAFRGALDNAHRWPGFLAWSATSTAFLKLEPDKERIREQLSSIMRTLYDGATVDELRFEFEEDFPESRSGIEEAVHLIHLSDVHIGSREANLRLERALRLLRDLRSEYGPRIIPIISGDLFDTPDRSQLDNVSRFLRDVETATGRRPFCVVGNHDVRRGGFMAQDAQPLLELQVFEPFRVYTEFGIGLLGLNSCDQGDLGRGEISEAQFYARSSALAKHHGLMWFGVVHHHPVPVDHPDWEDRGFLQRWFGSVHDATVDMANGAQLIEFCQKNGIGTLLHGHKHIPRFKEHNGVRVIGCGSTVGKIQTQDGNPYLSFNVLSVFPNERRSVTRLMAERVPGGGLDEQERHEFVHLG